MTLDNEMEVIKQKVAVIKRAGFGEVKIFIRNGIVHHIQSTEDELIDKKIN